MTRPRRLALALLACLVLGPCLAQQTSTDPSAVRTRVTGIKPLLTLAIDRGEAHGVLAGAGAAYVQRRFDATAPIEIDVRRLQTLPQPGCSRLEVITRQRNVRVDTTRADQELTYQLSFCRDGRFPEKR